MKILIFGATGRVGRHIVGEALKQKHAVTAFTRTPKELSKHSGQLRVASGNVLDARSVDSAIKGQDAVICAIGTRAKYPTKMLSEGTANIIAAMKKHRVKRFVCLTSVGALGSDAGFVLGKIMIPLFYKHVFDDKRRQVEEIMTCGLDWIIVRSPKMTDGPRTKQYHASLVRPIKNKVSRANVADFMLKQVKENRFLREMPIVSD